MKKYMMFTATNPLFLGSALFFSLMSSSVWGYELDLKLSASTLAAQKDTGNISQDQSTLGYGLGISLFNPIENSALAFGAGIEWLNIFEYQALGLRALEFKYTFKNTLAINGFAGGINLDTGADQQGYYFGLGLASDTGFKNTRIGLEAIYGSGLQRDKLLASDTGDHRPDIFLDYVSTQFFVSKRF